jgi:hypothetical protein
MLMTSHRTMTGDRPDVGVGEGYSRMIIESACIFRAVVPVAQRYVPDARDRLRVGLLKAWA